MRTDPQQHERFAGRYQLLRRLACGGMAEIFRARTLTPAARPVVIKRILPQLAAQDEFVEMPRLGGAAQRRLRRGPAALRADAADGRALEGLEREEDLAPSIEVLIDEDTHTGVEPPS